jgi:hypothetical protein
MKQRTITEITRRDIIDFFVVGEIDWAGTLTPAEFLGRLYDLVSLPSKDPRFRNARGDINMHTVNFQDWDLGWVFDDNRFGIRWVSDSEFLRFLCETLHPVVRPDPEHARQLAAQLNAYLTRDGWELFEEGELSGRPIFGARRSGQRAVIFDEPTGWEKVDRQMQEVRFRLQASAPEEQYQTIGLLCREILISLAQVVYDPSRHASPNRVAPSSSDAVRMLEAYFGSALPGSSNEEARAMAKASFKLAVSLQHDRVAHYTSAALCAEATTCIVNLVHILSGRSE